MIWAPRAIGTPWNLSRRVISKKKLTSFLVRFYCHLSNYREFLILNLNGWLFEKRSWGNQKKSRLFREPLMEFPKRHASPCCVLAWSNMDGKRRHSTNLPIVRKSFGYEEILANGFHFWYLGILLILDHYLVPIDFCVGPSWESDTCTLTIGGSTILSMEGETKTFLRNLSRDFIQTLLRPI